MTFQRGVGWRAALLITAIATSIALAACGSSSQSSSTTAASSGGPGGSAQNRSTLAACLKKHGVSLPAGFGGQRTGGAPPASGSGAGTPPAGGGRPGAIPGGNSKFQAALKACGANFRSPGATSGSFHAAIVKYAACVRQHGYQLPSPNFSGHGPVFNRKIETNAKFKTASKACQSLLATGGAPRPPTGSPG